MPKIIQLSAHVANLIAAGEVVERPASVVKELLENAVDAGASQVTVELRDGGMTFLRVTDNGCGMTAEDARTAFLRHATSKLRCPEDLNAIGTMGFRGEALAAIASVSRVDLLTKTAGAVAGTGLHLEAGQIIEQSEAGCPEGTTIIVRDLFFNTPARMKFMKQDSVEGAAVAAAVQRQALAHPQVAIRLLRDGKEILNTPGDGQLLSALAGVYGREAANLVPVESHWEKSKVWGYVSKPTQARASRTYQTFFVNDRPVKSKLLQSALEEAYRNQLMVGRFPACVLHLQVPFQSVDVNVHPAKTEVKFLSEREAFDCVHYGVLAALNKAQDRPELRLSRESEKKTEIPPSAPKKEPAFQTISAETYRQIAGVLAGGEKPDPGRARAAARAMEPVSVAQPVTIPRPQTGQTERPLPQEESKPRRTEARRCRRSFPCRRRSPLLCWASCFTPILWCNRAKRPFSLTSTPPMNGSCSTGSGRRSRKSRRRRSCPLRPAAWAKRARRCSWPICLCWMSWAMGWRNSVRVRSCCVGRRWISRRSRRQIASPVWPRICRRAAGKTGTACGITSCIRWPAKPPSRPGGARILWSGRLWCGRC